MAKNQGDISIDIKLNQVVPEGAEHQEEEKTGGPMKTFWSLYKFS